MTDEFWSGYEPPRRWTDDCSDLRRFVKEQSDEALRDGYVAVAIVGREMGRSIRENLINEARKGMVREGSHLAMLRMLHSILQFPAPASDQASPEGGAVNVWVQLKNKLEEQFDAQFQGCILSLEDELLLGLFRKLIEFGHEASFAESMSLRKSGAVA